MLLFILGAKLESKENLPNVLLFTIDACRPDHFGCYGYPRNTTPHIDKLAKEGALFTNAFSQSAWTTPGMISIFTSLYPSTHNVDTKDKTLGDDILTLPKVLKKNGYGVPVLIQFVEIPNYWHLGFDAVDEYRYMLEGEDLEKLLNAYKNQTFFTWYHFHALHLPYNPPSPYSKIFHRDTGNDKPADSEAVAIVKRNSLIKNGSIIFNSEDKNNVVALYDGLLKQLDDCIERITEKMRECGMLDNTLIIITSDHGEELFEHGFIGHASTSANAKLYDEIIHIPLIIWWPKKLKHKIADELVQQIDIMPTILDMLGLPIPKELQGNSLLPLMKGKSPDNPRSVFCETILGGYQSTKETEEIKLRCIRTKKWKLIYTTNLNSANYELYNLKKDPKEEKNIVEKYPDVAKELKEKLFLWIETTTQKGNASIVTEDAKTQ